MALARTQLTSDLCASPVVVSIHMYTLTSRGATPVKSLQAPQGRRGRAAGAAPRVRGEAAGTRGVLHARSAELFVSIEEHACLIHETKAHK